MCMLLSDCPEHPGCAWVQIAAQESITGLAKRFYTTTLQIMELNPYLDPAELIEGMPVLVPLPPRFAHARYGQTLTDLLRENALEEAAFLSLNPHLRGSILLPGQRLRLS